ncbi:MAG TPA: TRAP transporter small permease, partial [Methylomirabilota bacterium]|nr:TRAP transporter small permease [Methylomirabilota bacterium]
RARVNRWLDRLEEGACVVLLAVMTGVALLNVITRYVVRYSLAFTEEVVVSLFVWLTLFGTAVAFREGAHLGFTYLVERLPRPLQRGAVWLAAALAVVLFAALIWFGVGQIRSERMLGTTSEALAIPQWWYTAGIPAIGLLVLARIVQGALRADRTLRG